MVATNLLAIGDIEVPGGIELSFRPDAEAELHLLVAAERACCAWAEWSISESGDTWLLTVTGAGFEPVAVSGFESVMERAEPVPVVGPRSSGLGPVGVVVFLQPGGAVTTHDVAFRAGPLHRRLLEGGELPSEVGDVHDLLAFG